MHSSRAPRRLPDPVRVAVAALVCVVVGACGGGPGEPRQSGRGEHEVAADPHATAEDIVAAGRPVDVAASDGLTLVTYRVESDDDEGPQQGAWRLYDAQDDPLADGTLGQVREQGAVATVQPLPDGFLVEGYVTPGLLQVGTDGRVTRVAEPTRTATARAGDVLVEHGLDAGPAFYRPADRTAYLLPPVPYRDVQQVGLADDGTVWVMLPWTRRHVRLVRAAGGAAPWKPVDLSVPPGLYPSGDTIGLTADHGRVVVTLAAGSDEAPALRRFEVLDPASGRWRPVDAAGIDLEDASVSTVQVLPDGRLVVGGFRAGAWLEQPDGTFSPLDLPRPETSDQDLSVDVAGDRMFALPALGRRLWVSTDLGDSWKIFRP